MFDDDITVSSLDLTINNVYIDGPYSSKYIMQLIGYNFDEVTNFTYDIKYITVSADAVVDDEYIFDENDLITPESVIISTKNDLFTERFSTSEA